MTAAAASGAHITCGSAALPAAAAAAGLASSHTLLTHRPLPLSRAQPTKRTPPLQNAGVLDIIRRTTGGGLDV
jgi:hypothetical protein